MKTFLQEIARELIHRVTDFRNTVLVLPNKRAGVFLKNELLQQLNATVYAPELYSIEDFTAKIARLKAMTPTELLLEFYALYKAETPVNPESLSEFCRWAPVALRDFNEIDAYLADGKALFAHLSNIKELQHWYVNPEKTELQKNYIHFWNQLGGYYHRFRDRLLKKGSGYPGLIYREACNRAAGYLKENPEKQHFFIGLNALNRAEETLLQTFLLYPANEVYWDIDEAFLADEEHDAGFFVRTYQKTWPHYKKKPFKNSSGGFKTPKQLTIVGIPKNVGQAKYVGKLLSESAIDVKNAAVVLGDEALLTPMLHSIPESIGAVNITCGIALHQTPPASFFRAWLTAAERANPMGWYYKEVINVLTHPLAQRLLGSAGEDYARSWAREMQAKNKIFITPAHLQQTLPHELKSVMKLLLPEGATTVNQLLEIGIDLLLNFRTCYEQDIVYLEYLCRFHEIFNQLTRLNEQYGSITDFHSFRKVYEELLHAETVHFSGEPLQGLQVMGMLESRCLDFEHLIITSVNEGVLPSGKRQTSFIPYDLRMAFQLPGHRERDAMYSYHFYRLLQRAQNIYLLYNTEADGLTGNEESRFLRQLTLLPHPLHTVKRVIAAPLINHSLQKPIEIAKSPQLIVRLKQLLQQGISTTALITYLRNPVDFYHQVVLAVRAGEPLEETVTARTLGIIIHRVLETFYKPLEGCVLLEAHLAEMDGRIKAVVEENFRRFYSDEHFNRGKNLISLRIAEHYIARFLRIERNRLRKGEAIEIGRIEQPLKVELQMSELSTPVTLKGTLDRVEMVNGRIAIIDYKTGGVRATDVEITAGESIADYKRHKAFQLLSYAYLYAKNYGTGEMEASVLSFKSLKSGYLKFHRKEISERKAVKRDIIDGAVLDWYEAELIRLLQELLDERLPFCQQEEGGYL